MEPHRARRLERLEAVLGVLFAPRLAQRVERLVEWALRVGVEQAREVGDDLVRDHVRARGDVLPDLHPEAAEGRYLPKEERAEPLVVSRPHRAPRGLALRDAAPVDGRALVRDAGARKENADAHVTRGEAQLAGRGLQRQA